MSGEYSRVWTESGLETRERPGKVAALEYYAPATLKEAETLKQQRKGSHYLAGGTILNWKGAPRGKGLIDLKHLQLDTIEVTTTVIRIGAMVTIQTLAEHLELPESLKKAAALFSSKNVRNMATIGGSATGNFFVSDLLPVLLAFQAEVEYFYRGVRSTLPLAEWLREKNGIICAILLKKLQRQVTLRQEKISKMDFPLLVSSIGAERSGDVLSEAVAAFSGASAKIVISEAGAAYLNGKSVNDIDPVVLNEIVQQDIHPTENVKATARVKRSIIADHLRQLIADLEK